jgi:hypothetical protein
MTKPIPQTMSSNVQQPALSADNLMKDISTRRLIQAFNEGGYSVLAHNKLSPHDYKHKMIEKKMFDRRDRQVDKMNFDTVLNFISRFRSRKDIDTRGIDFHD